MKTRRDLIDLTGQQFGQWTVLLHAGLKTYPSGVAKTMWVCHCGGCGRLAVIQAQQLRQKATTRCTHCAHTKTRLHCDVAGCKREPDGRFCEMHAKRLRRTGKLGPAASMKPASERRP